MGIQHPTANDAALARERSAFLARHRLKDFKLSGRSLMRMVRRCCVDRPPVDRIRGRFTHQYGTDLKMESRTWDHLEMFGRGGHLMALVAHPYSISDAGREDMALFHRAGLNVVECGPAQSWYGFGTTQLRVEHPELAGKRLPPPAWSPKVEPAPTAPPASHRPLPGPMPYATRLHRAAPALLAIARTFAVQLAEAMRLVPCTCTCPGGATPCVHCTLRDDFDRIAAVIREIDGGPS